MANQSLKIKTARTRRPAFDRERGVETARELFHARGYDAVGIAELTKALDIVPPSLYAAYGSKLALFERALQSYIAKQMLPLDKILSSDAPPPRRSQACSLPQPNITRATQCCAGAW